MSGRNDHWERETCRYCGRDLPYCRAHGLCSECWKSSVRVARRNPDGSLVCPLCHLAGEPTSVDDRQQHLEDEHGISPGEDLKFIAAKRRLSEDDTDGGGQQRLIAFE